MKQYRRGPLTMWTTKLSDVKVPGPSTSDPLLRSGNWYTSGGISHRFTPDVRPPP